MVPLKSLQEGMSSQQANNTEWAVRTFEVWRTARNKKHPLDVFFGTFLYKRSPINLRLAMQICSERDGMEYTPRSLYLLLSALQRQASKAHPFENMNFFKIQFVAPLRLFVMQSSSVCIVKG